MELAAASFQMRTGQQTFTVLLIEENPTDARRVRQILTEPACAETYDVVHFECIDQAMDKLDDPGLDAIVIGLEVPDIAALRTLKAFRALVSRVPTIALVRSTDEWFGVDAIRAGAEDCLFKNELDRTLLPRSLRHSIERHKLLTARRDPAGTDETRNELEAWAAMCKPSPLPVAQKSFGQSSLKESAGSLFGDLARQYLEILDHSLEERAMKTKKGVVEQLKSLADELGALGAGPRDVVELHTAAITTKLHGQPLPKAKAYVIEGRLLLLKLMGDLASFYRNLSLGKAPQRGGTLPASRTKPIQRRDARAARNKDGQ
jgi:DNA-binding NarL/FixJ family response regulator